VNELEVRVKAVICGAGIAGLTLAWWLRHDGWQVRIVEQAPGPRAGGYMMDFFGAGFDVAEVMGLRPALRAVHSGITEVRYLDPDGRRTGGFAYESFARLFDGRVFSFMRGDLEHALHKALGGAVDVRYGTSVERVVDTGEVLQIVDTHGETEAADLLVGADGLHSRIRALVFGDEERFLRPLGYHAASYRFVDESLRAEVGERAVLVEVPGRQAGVYPTTYGDLACTLIHRACDPARPADPVAAIRTTYADLGPLVAAALRRCPPADRLYSDVVAQVEMPSWHRGRVALVGDACQAVSLMAGQGASLAMAGAYALAAQLADQRDVTAALSGYERRMRPVVADTQRSGRRTANWLVPATQWRITARNAALALAGLPGISGLLRPATRGMRHRVVGASPQRAA
jgi:2-polyprenyl-6-methoxyphenol hydroxylase-like FAD-dependent oxidoreductase